MGGSASTGLVKVIKKRINKSDLPPELDRLIDFQGTKTIEEVIGEISDKTDVFLTHNWGKGPDHTVHKLVGRINDALNKKKIRTWFDGKRMEGDVASQMTRGIDNTRLVLAFLTRDYIDKVRQINNPNDNCKLEFKYAASRKTSANMLAVVLEPGIRDTKTWDGEVGMFLGSNLYFDFADWNDANFDALFESLYIKIIEKLNAPIDDVLEQINWSERERVYLASKSVDSRLELKNVVKCEEILSESENFLSEQLSIVEARRVGYRTSMQAIDADYEKLIEYLNERRSNAAKQFILADQSALESEKIIRCKFDEVANNRLKAERVMSIRDDDDEIARVSQSLRDYVGNANPELLSVAFKDQFNFKDSIPKAHTYTPIDFSNCSIGSVKSVAAIIETKKSPTGLYLWSPPSPLEDPLIYVSGQNGIDVFNALSGLLVKTINNNDKDKLQYPSDVFISAPLSPGEDPLVYVLENNNEASRVQVFNATTGSHVKMIAEYKDFYGRKFNTQVQYTKCYTVAICLSPPISGVDPLIYIAYYIKYYTSDNYGYIEVFNANSGAHIKTIHTDDSKIGRLGVLSGMCILAPRIKGEDPILYVSDQTSKRVVSFNAATGDPARVYCHGELAGPWGIAMSSPSSPKHDPLLYVCDSSNILVYNVTTGFKVETYIGANVAVRGLRPSRLCLSPSKSSYVNEQYIYALCSNCRICKFNVDLNAHYESCCRRETVSKVFDL